MIDGPLQGDWLSQVALNWLGEQGSLDRFEYTNRRAAYLGETLTSGGRVVSVDRAKQEISLELYIKNGDGDVITPVHATVHLHT